tara:strand:- start:106 stop:393 length:288 start_codon:yes stop_codon:yes gene_type:complete
MSKKILQYVVLALAILIIFCFVALIVGVYLKITGNQNISEYNINNISLGLAESEKITDIKVINENQLLIIISNSENTYGYVYDTEKNLIISNIKR